jgi:hypothetical protein
VAWVYYGGSGRGKYNDAGLVLAFGFTRALGITLLIRGHSIEMGS